MTPGERKALMFLAGIGVLGAGARLASAPRSASTAEDRAALRGQIAAVDSAREASHRDPPRTSRRRRAPRDDSVSEAPPSERRARVAALPPQSSPSIGPVDLDAADAGAIESLPGIGPALAKRIVDDRAAHGPFGSTEALQRVRGVGPKLAAKLVTRVTFSSTRPP